MVGFRGGGDAVPCWLATMMGGESFFNPCSTHEAAARKNERNIFCLDCCISFCHHCLPTHPAHRLLQIRRYVYQNVVRVDDLEKLFDCAFVQSYTTNNAKVVFINERPQTRPFRSSGNICITCDRTLQEPYLFCSLSCKVKHLLRTKDAISKHLYECNFLPLPSSCDLDDGQLTPDSVLDSPILSSGSSAGGCGGAGGLGCRTVACTAGTEFVRKKRSSVGSAARAAARSLCAEPANRRKGVPSRAPLY